MSRYIRADRRGRRIRGNSATSAVRHKTNEGQRVACFGALWYLQRDGGVPSGKASHTSDRWITVGRGTTRAEATERQEGLRLPPGRLERQRL